MERIVAASPGLDVLDVGCGTGIAARQFQAAGCRVLGVDPDGRMADLARPSGIEVEVAKFEPWDPAGRGFAAVYRQVMPDSPGNFWASRILDVYSVMFSQAADGIREAAAFSGPEQWQFGWARPYTRDQWLEQVPLSSGPPSPRPASVSTAPSGSGPTRRW